MSGWDMTSSLWDMAISLDDLYETEAILEGYYGAVPLDDGEATDVDGETTGVWPVEACGEPITLELAA